jgi:hypothetical protein
VLEHQHFVSTPAPLDVLGWDAHRTPTEYEWGSGRDVEGGALVQQRPRLDAVAVEQKGDPRVEPIQLGVRETKVGEQQFRHWRRILFDV